MSPRANPPPDTAEVDRRRALIPEIGYPSELPITQRRDELLRTIADNQVVIVAGETGSGKSTQLPKMCLELGRGAAGLIGHTQPRRLAARSIAERVAEEIGTTVGELVGYTVRFTDEVGDDTLLKLMTDGILLSEMQRDRDLLRYDTIIIDEAHERSLNIDFLLGYLKRLLPRRPDLKLIVTSATIDTSRFSAHFNDAPIVEVSGRTHPVEIRYAPLGDPDDPDAQVLDQTEGICAAVKELQRDLAGDILVFCAGERDIRDAAEALEALRLRDTEILPLYARLSAAEQHRVFEAHSKRRVVLATNVAETSLTVPGIRSVVDPGNARISRFNRRTKVQRLPIESVSQASADQRAGRCGRLGPGVCIRLYATDDFDARPQFTEPEILRTNLASVILAMTSLGLGEVESFPFIEPPDTHSIRDGIALLEKHDSEDPERVGKRGRNGWLTGTGRRMARIPLDPRLARVVLEAADLGCLREILVIVSGLSIQDPRERPKGKEQVADEFHSRYRDPESDFLSYLHLWQHLRDERRARSGNQFRKMCRNEFVHFLRVREWQDVHGQLRRVCDDLGLRRNRNDAPPDLVHKALLTGFLSHIGFLPQDTKAVSPTKLGRRPPRAEYRGARSARFTIAPGSTLRSQSPRWVMAGELVETDQLRARVVARIRTEWIEQAADHLLRWEWTDPWWDPSRGAAMCTERASLHGLPVVADRRINLQRVNAPMAREMFVLHALVERDWDSPHKFLLDNSARIDEVLDLQLRLRRDDLMSDDRRLTELYLQRIPDSIVSAAHFDRWWKKAGTTDPRSLDLSVTELLDPGVGPIDPDGFPDEWIYGDLRLPVHYEFDSESPTDGATFDVPVDALSRVAPEPFRWNVPGLRAEVVEELIRSLPKAIRRSLVPVPETILEVMPLLDTDKALVDQLRSALSQVRRVELSRDDFDLSALPTHLKPHFRILDDDGVLAEDDDLDLLKNHIRQEARILLSVGRHPLERTGLTTWDFGDLPKVIESEGLGHIVQSFPSLVDDHDTVSVQLLATRDEQVESMWAGTRRLLLCNRPSMSKVMRPILTNEVKLAIVISPYQGPAEWFDDCVSAAVDDLLASAGGPVWTPDAFADLLSRTRANLPRQVEEVALASVEALTVWQHLSRRLQSFTAQSFQPTISDIDEQIHRLVYPGFVAGVGGARLADLARYLMAADRRLDRLADTVSHDREIMRTIRGLEAQHERLLDSRPWSPELEDLTWSLQELRVSLFAQAVGAKGKVSVKRIRSVLETLEAI